MLAEGAWTSHTETQRHIDMDVPDYKPEECPGVSESQIVTSIALA